MTAGTVTVIGLDLAKNVFQLHGIDAEGRVLMRRQVRRHQLLKYFEQLPRCLVGMEACATAHYWGRELKRMGFEVKLMPPAYVRPYVKRGKNDAADAKAICEAVTRPTMRFVPIKSSETQALLMQHKTRDLLVRQRTALINALRGHLAEFGIVTAKGSMGVRAAIEALQSAKDELPVAAGQAFEYIRKQLEEFDVKIAELDRIILKWCRTDAAARRLMTIPGVGPLTASAISASVGNASEFKSPRQFSAWLGLTPRQNSSGGKEKMGGITKQGDRNIRRLLVVGATALLRRARTDEAKFPWLAQLLQRKPARLASVAVANKTARIAWAILRREEVYRSAAVRSNPTPA
ncbi:MAG: IS110 family transposase [Alphaproteobacteria bacterium]